MYKNVDLIGMEYLDVGLNSIVVRDTVMLTPFVIP
jgi:hypothetical protein